MVSSLTTVTVSPTAALNSVGCAEFFVLDTGSSPVWEFCFFTLPVVVTVPLMTASVVATVTTVVTVTVTVGVGRNGADDGNGTVADAIADGSDGAGDGGAVVVGGDGVTMACHSGLDAGIQTPRTVCRRRRQSSPASRSAMAMVTDAVGGGVGDDIN